MGEINIFNFKPLLEKTGCKIYVETGTGVGVCLSHMLNYNFDEYHSIDLDPKQINAAIKKFQNINVFFYNDFSTEALKRIVPILKKDVPVFFFLDAHFPDADFNGASYEETILKFKDQAMPLWDELKIIRSARDTSKDVFVIDDWKIYDPRHNYQYGGWEYGVVQEKAGIMSDGQKIIDLFSDTHDCHVDTNHQGFLFITPK